MRPVKNPIGEEHRVSSLPYQLDDDIPSSVQSHLKSTVPGT